MRIAFIPDAQVRPGVPIDHLRHVGQYIADKQPEVIVCAGDFADMPSCSTHDEPGSMEAQGRRYADDFASVHRAMDVLLEPIAKARGYNPRKVMLLGNHEDRITRTINANPKLEGLLSLDRLGYEERGWEVHPFLDVVVIRGVAFSHYLTSGPMCRPITTAAALLAKRHMPAVVGHQQGLQQATAVRADGVLMNGIICGACYQHKEKYLTPQGNNHFRGMLFLNDVQRNGEFEPMPLTLRFLKRRYG